MAKSIGVAVLALVLGGCAYSPTPAPSVMPADGGYTLNDNGYMTYYTPKSYPVVDCKNDRTWRCEDRLSYDAAFCAGWEASGRCGDAAIVTEPSGEVSPAPPGGREWWMY